MDTIYRWIAYSLPQRLVYWAAVRVSNYGNTNVRVSTALRRWQEGHK